ncbi:hypothetical protein HYY71_05560 [Candidatus Woesearchaeota archaeon]|nr:hypothetical protein [Candidatus Woesearchaeota archaeon]
MPQYNKMNKKIILSLLLLILLPSIASAEKYFVLNVNHALGSVTFNSIALRDIDKAVKNNEKSGFAVKALSFDSSNIGTIYYNMSENKNYLIYMPYKENAARIELYNPQNSKIMELDVSSFSNTCGNNVCEGHESHESCTKDCPSGSKDDFCDSISDGICDPDCSPKTDSDCGISVSSNLSAQASSETGKKITSKNIEEKKNPNYVLWISILFFVLLIGAIFLFIKKKKESQIIESLRDYISQNIRSGFSLQQIKEALYKGGYSEKDIEKAVKSIGN